MPYIAWPYMYTARCIVYTERILRLKLHRQTDGQTDERTGTAVRVKLKQRPYFARSVTIFFLLFHHLNESVEPRTSRTTREPLSSVDQHWALASKVAISAFVPNSLFFALRNMANPKAKRDPFDWGGGGGSPGGGEWWYTLQKRRCPGVLPLKKVAS